MRPDKIDDWERKQHRTCRRCKSRLPFHEDGCPAVKEKKRKPWRRYHKEIGQDEEA